MHQNKLRHLWRENKTAFNAWLTIPCAWTAELLAHAGFDALTIDMQHGLADYQTAVSMLRSISTGTAVPLVRVPWNEPSAIMRLLDAGVYGIIAPMINNRAQAEALVGACRYPPNGYRSYGPIRANVYGGDKYFQEANNTIVTFAMIETLDAFNNLDEILTVEGLDGAYVGTVDLSISMGLGNLVDLNNPELMRAITNILEACARHDRVAGIHAQTPQSAKTLSELGFRLITAVNDSFLLGSAAKDVLQVTRKEIGDRRSQ